MNAGVANTIPTLTTSRVPADAMDHCETDAETVANNVRDLLNYAAEKPAVQVNEDTNTVTASIPVIETRMLPSRSRRKSPRYRNG
ncbi:hypothetical protein MAUB1S_04211 [Mycolicibacterium aubagnense]